MAPTIAMTSRGPRKRLYSHRHDFAVTYGSLALPYITLSIDPGVSFETLGYTTARTGAKILRMAANPSKLFTTYVHFQLTSNLLTVGTEWH